MWTNYPQTAAVVDDAAQHGDDVFKTSSPEFNTLFKRATKLYKAEGGVGELSKKSVQVNNASEVLLTCSIA